MKTLIIDQKNNMTPMICTTPKMKQNSRNNLKKQNSKRPTAALVYDSKNLN